MFFFSPTYLLFMGPALLFMLFAQWRVKSAYKKWSQVGNGQRMSGMQVAERLLEHNGLFNVSTHPIPGEMTDSYDPRSNTLNISAGTANGASVASMAVVAHEIGHAMQDDRGFALMSLRSGLVPAVNFGSQLGPILFFAGLIFTITPLMWLGIIFFSGALVFTLITLPVELDASRRALNMLTTSGLVVSREERKGARAVLSAAALTYVAAMLTALLQLAYYVMLANSRSRRR